MLFNVSLKRFEEASSATHFANQEASYTGTEGWCSDAIRNCRAACRSRQPQEFHKHPKLKAASSLGRDALKKFRKGQELELRRKFLKRMESSGTQRKISASSKPTTLILRCNVFCLLWPLRVKVDGCINSSLKDSSSIRWP